MGVYCGKQKQSKSRKPAYRSKRKVPANNVVPKPHPLPPPDPPISPRAVKFESAPATMQKCHDHLWRAGGLPCVPSACAPPVFASVEVVNGNIMHHPAMPEIYDANMMHIEANLPNAMPLQQIMMNGKVMKKKGASLAEHRLERKRLKKKKGAGTGLEITMKKKRRKKKKRKKKRRRSSQSNSNSRSYNSQLSHLDSSFPMHFQPSYSSTSETLSEYSSNGESNDYRIPVDLGFKNDYNVSSASVLSDYGVFLPPQTPRPNSAVPYFMHASSPQLFAKSQSLHSAPPVYSFSAPPRAGKVRRAQTLSYDMPGMDLARPNSYHLGLHE